MPPPIPGWNNGKGESTAKFEVTVLLISIKVPEFKMPPPTPALIIDPYAEFPLMVLFKIVAFPSFFIPPQCAAPLPVIVLLMRLKVPEFMMAPPPPKPVTQLSIVMSEIVTCAPVLVI
jgi:hypothetical protein